MPVLRVLITAVALTAVLCATAVAASLPVNQRFSDAKEKVSLLTRSGGKGSVTARTRCGRFADRRVRISRGRITSTKGARFRITGVVTSRSTLRLSIRRGTCATTFSLKRVTKPQ
jgi:hypothetical protein